MAFQMLWMAETGLGYVFCIHCLDETKLIVTSKIGQFSGRAHDTRVNAGDFHFTCNQLIKSVELRIFLITQSIGASLYLT